MLTTSGHMLRLIGFGLPIETTVTSVVLVTCLKAISTVRLARHGDNMEEEEAGAVSS